MSPPPTIDVRSSSTALADVPVNTALGAYTKQFGTLGVPTEAQLKGRFKAEFVGPLWLRLSAKPSIELFGLRGFWGKELSGFGEARNLVTRGEQIVTSLPMELGISSSKLDGRPCAALSYGASVPLPWRKVRDELRVLSEGRLLGMTLVDAPLLRHLSFPFVLVRNDG